MLRIEKWFRAKINRLLFKRYDNFDDMVSDFISWRETHIAQKRFNLILSMLIGIAAGFAAVWLKTVVFFFRGLLLNDLSFDYHNLMLLVYPTVGIGLTLLMKHFIIKDNQKHDISAILYVISRENGQMPKHKMFSSILGAAFTASFGGSIGLESPIISSGSAIGSNLARVLRLDYKSITLFIACGAAGAIAAIFNTPMAAIVFAFEVLLIDLSQFTLIPLLVASVSGAIVSKVFFRTDLLFDIQIKEAFTSHDIPFFILFAILCGIVSYYFSATFLYIEKRFAQIKRGRYKLLVGGIALGILIFVFPPLFGEGFATIRAILTQNYDKVLHNSPLYYILKDNFWAVAFFFLALVLLKVIATATTMGAGGIGGIFAPSLFTGAAFGFLFTYGLNATGFIYLSNRNFALVGMAGLLAGVLHAPLTGVFLIAEITNGYSLMVPLLLCTTISYLTSKYIEPQSIFTMLLAKRGQLITHHKDKAVLTRMKMDDVLETDYTTISLDSTLGDLIRTVSHCRGNIFPVVDEENILMGIVELEEIRDMMFDPKQYDTSIWNIMDMPEAEINTTDSMETVMRKFHDTESDILPVVIHGQYVGFISRTRLLSLYRELLLDITSD